MNRRFEAEYSASVNMNHALNPYQRGSIQSSRYANHVHRDGDPYEDEDIENRPPEALFDTGRDHEMQTLDFDIGPEVMLDRILDAPSDEALGDAGIPHVLDCIDLQGDDMMVDDYEDVAYDQEDNAMQDLNATHNDSLEAEQHLSDEVIDMFGTKIRDLEREMYGAYGGQCARNGRPGFHR